MRNDSFFDEAREQSLVKTEIVRKYFWAWAKVMIPLAKKKGQHIAYVDLFCGPGRYMDGTESTPILVLKAALQDLDMEQMLVTWFNDRNPEYVKSLRQEIEALAEISKLRHKPKLTSREVGPDVIATLKKAALPTLFFVDPWGYNGLSLELLNSAIENWGCDCIFFFNYNRINMALTNPVFHENMASLFGAERANGLTCRLAALSPDERELTIIEAITQALNEPERRFVLPFRFRPTTKTSHHLIFVSKHVLGYSIMKDIMWKESSNAPQGIAAFEYNPATKKQPTLFHLAATIDDLGDMLLHEFAGRTLTAREIYEAHHVGRRFVEQNYKQVLLALEAEGAITANPPAVARPPQKARRKGTFGDAVRVTFPSRIRS